MDYAVHDGIAREQGNQDNDLCRIMIFFPHSPSSSTLESNGYQLGWSFNKGQDLSMKTATPWQLKAFDEKTEGYIIKVIFDGTIPFIMHTLTYLYNF
jgi:hypothetical protein